MALRLNLGCGNRKLAGWVNVDKVAACDPDQVCDLEQFPWPWPDNSVEAVQLHHVLEHLGASTDTYLGIVKELYRVCRGGAKIEIAVPHPRHDDFLTDPTHVRPITLGGLEMFSQASNRKWIAGGGANTPLGIYLGVDFSMIDAQQALEEPWRSKAQSGEISPVELRVAAMRYNNVVKTTHVVLQVVKPPGSAQ
jgi:hypothetical protein